MVSLQSVLRGLKWNTGTSNGRHGTPYPENLISILLHADANMFPNIRLLIEVRLYVFGKQFRSRKVFLCIEKNKDPFT